MQMRINGTGMEVLSVQFPNGVQGAIVTNPTPADAAVDSLLDGLGFEKVR